MKSLLGTALLVFTAAPAFAVVQVAPAPEIGFGLPAIFAAIAAGVLVLVLRRKRATH